MNTSGNIAVVTGAGRGLGLALATEIARRGVPVIGLVRDPAAIAAPDGVRLVECDVADASAVQGGSVACVAAVATAPTCSDSS